MVFFPFRELSLAHAAQCAVRKLFNRASLSQLPIVRRSPAPLPSACVRRCCLSVSRLRRPLLLLRKSPLGFWDVGHAWISILVLGWFDCVISEVVYAWKVGFEILLFHRTYHRNLIAYRSGTHLNKLAPSCRSKFKL
ncbi:hypothetical protein Csa_008655 [Cucumis sativus]|uniref:Uncharacterized protein n=1 Tax=Cucumis sativus TaxID=3659 RepID=A0A0A0KQR1_CUCSA|nr:hypothetical protein Csa_008655 [Cucumis sativus]